ncbi:MAG: hypothetical protein V1494_05630 [Candidatus Diapherotrites archaeon]
MISMKYLLLTLFCLLFLLIGCLKFASNEERFACISLASYAQTSIPECKSQEDCFAKLQKLLPIDAELFSPSLQRLLAEYQNHLARAWLYFNLALSDVKKIRETCLASNDLSGIPPFVNSLAFNASNAFREMDSAAELSSNAIAIETAELSSQEINLIKEEPLFSDFVELNENLAELKSNEIMDSGTYTGTLRVNSQKLALLLSGVDSAENLSANRLLQQRNFGYFFPVLLPLSNSLISVLSVLMEPELALKKLSSLPSFGLFSALDSIIGAQNSAAKKFSDLLNSDALHRCQLSERNSELKQKTQSLFSELSQTISSIDSAAFSSFDQNFLSKLYSLLGEQSNATISSSVYSFRDISTLKRDSSQKLAELSSRFNSSEMDELLGASTIGETTSSLKQIFSETAALKENIDFLYNESINSLSALCTAKSKEIDARLKSSSFSEANETVFNLASRVRFKLSRFNEAETEREKLLQCSVLVEEFASLESAQKDFVSFELELGGDIKECISQLDKIFSGTQNGTINDFRANYSQLKSLSAQPTDAIYLKNACISLKQAVENALMQEDAPAAIASNAAKSKEILAQLDSLRKISPEAVSSSRLDSLREKISLQEKYFSAGKLDFAVAAPVLRELELSSQKILDEASALLLGSLKTFLEKNALLEFFSTETVEANKKVSSRLKLSLENPISDFPFPLDLSIPFSSSATEKTLSFSTPNISSAELTGKAITLKLSSVPLGPTAAVFDLNEVLAETTEKTSLLFIDSSSAFFEKTISLDAKALIPKLKVASSLSLKGSADIPRDVSVFVECAPANFSLEGGSLFLLLENVKGGKKISAFFSLQEPIDFSFEFSSKKQLDENSFEYVFLLRLKNLLPIELNETRIAIPAPIESENPEAASLFSSDGKKIALEFLPPGKISFKLPQLQPMQSTALIFSFTAKNEEAYWRAFFLDLRQRLSLLSSSPNQQFASSASALLSELSLLESVFNENDRQKVEQAVSLLKNASLLEQSASSAAELESKLFLLSSEVSSAISNAEQQLKELNSLGFTADALELRKKISSVQTFFEQAQQLKSSGKNEEALAALFDAKNILSSIQPKNAQEILLSARDSLAATAMDSFSLLESLGVDDANYSSLKENFLSLDELFSRNISSGEMPDAKQSLAALNSAAEDLNSFAENFLESKTSSALQKIALLEELSGKTIPSKIMSLQRMFDDLASDSFQSIEFVSPISKERLEKISLSIESLSDPLLAQQFSEFKRLSKSEKFEEALQKAASFEPKLDSALEKAKSFDNELSLAIDSLKEEAFAAYSMASLKLNNSEPNSQAESFLEKAEKKLEGGDYFKALAFSQAATALLSLKQPTALIGLGVPLSAYPLLAIIAGGIIFIYWKKHNEKNNAPQMKKIPKSE